MRHGHRLGREIQTGLGAVGVARVRIRTSFGVEPNLRWRSDGFEVTCDNSARARIAPSTR